jgi:ParB-like chromosome segregation protein Spo0J
MSDGKREIQIWDIDRLIPHPKNPKKHSQEQVERLARSIEKLGITPIMVEPDGTIIAGHGRRLSLMFLGRKRVPVDVRDDLTKAQCDALRIADNAASSNEIDYDLLTEEAIRLSDDGFDLKDMGLTDKEIESMTVDIGEIDESAFTSDIVAAVEEQKIENKKAEAAADAKESPVGEVLGFKKVTAEQARHIRGFMARVEAETKLTGAAALVAFINA